MTSGQRGGQGPGDGEGRYGAVPPGSPGWGVPIPRERPATVKAGLGSLAASLAAGVVLSAVTFGDLDHLVAESLASAGPDAGFTAAGLRAELVAVAAGVLVLAVLEAVSLWFAWQGGNRARIALWVIGALTVLFGVLALAAPPSAPGSLTLIWLLQMALTAVGMALLALEPSNDWYRTGGGRRATGARV